MRGNVCILKNNILKNRRGRLEILKVKIMMGLLFFQPFRGASAKNAGMCLSSQYAIQVIYVRL